MAESKSSATISFEDEFRKALEECEDLYISCAQECGRSHPELIGKSRRDFVRRMIDLSHGLVLKIFVEVAYADRKWSAEDLLLAAILFEHVWGHELNDKQVRKTLAHYLQQTGLTWDVLLGPFVRLGAFRNQVHQLQTIALRLGNVIAKADGNLLPEEVQKLRWIHSQLQRVLVPVPLAGDTPEPVANSDWQKIPGENFELSGLPSRDATVPSSATYEPIPSENALNDAIAELDGLIGLDIIKQEVRGLVNFLKVQKAREQFNLPQTKISLHSVFRGNPGTGKTTVARLLGRIFGAMGILTRGHLVETDRSGLVAEYAGQTAPKAHKKIDEALDGVLFIDEAYSLVAETGDDPYGTEALQVLLKRMEDNRDRLVIILAGYPQPLERLLRSNPGLSSRFSRQFTFPDYSAAELGRIFESLCLKDGYSLPNLTRVKLLLGFQHLLDNSDEHFGNGRLVRNAFEQSIGFLANRIIGILPLTRELLTTLEPEDIQLEDIPVGIWENLEDETRNFRVVCPHCQHAKPTPQRLLGRQVLCKRCQQTFTADWGDPLTEDVETG